jgi:hypothetical protein
MKTILILLAAVTTWSAVQAADFEIRIGPRHHNNQEWREYRRYHENGYWTTRRYFDEDRGVWVERQVWVPYE